MALFLLFNYHQILVALVIKFSSDGMGWDGLSSSPPSPTIICWKS